MKSAPIVLSDSLASEAQRVIALSLRNTGWQVETCWILKASDYFTLAARRGLAHWWLRFLMYGAYPVKLLWRILRAPEGSIFVVSSNTFYAPGLAALAGAVSRCRVVHLLYDLYPDALEVAGKVRTNGVAAKTIGAFMRLTQRRCIGTVYIGRFMGQHMARRWAPGRRECTIFYGTDRAIVSPVECAPASVPLLIRYGGNLGYMHDVESLTACVRSLARRQDVRFDFAIYGIGLKKLKAAFAGLPVNVAEPSPKDWGRQLMSYPVGLVSLSPGGATICFPSKIFGMLAAGQAVIAICPAWSDLAQIVRDYDVGWIVNNSPYQAAEQLEGPDYLLRARALRPLAEVVQDFTSLVAGLLNDLPAVEQKRRNVHRAAGILCGPSAFADQWNAFLGGLPPAGQRGGSGVC